MGSHMSQTEENQPLQNSPNKKNRGTPALPLGAQWAPKFVCMHPRGSLPQQPIKGQNWPNPLEPRIWTTPEVTVNQFLGLKSTPSTIQHRKKIDVVTGNRTRGYRVESERPNHSSTSDCLKNVVFNLLLISDFDFFNLLALLYLCIFLLFLDFQA